MSKELLNFKIGLSGTSPIKQPEFSIFIGDTEFYSGMLRSEKNETEYFSFDAEIEEGDSALIIQFKNKFSTDTIKDSANNIIQDLMLNIDSVEIDEINLGQMLWTHSKYFPNYPEDYVDEQAKNGINLDSCVNNCVNLGWNGKWTLPFKSPLYIWILENI